MSLVFADSVLEPSNIVQLPNEFWRPSFGELYGFDEDSSTTRAYYDTQANIEARSGEPVGKLYYAYDSNRLYVYDGANWQYYTST
tara:strand:+ start:492 stop:746 length:255 start_codon:yes stop_codon:yes gene_type:complete